MLLSVRLGACFPTDVNIRCLFSYFKRYVCYFFPDSGLPLSSPPLRLRTGVAFSPQFYLCHNKLTVCYVQKLHFEHDKILNRLAGEGIFHNDEIRYE